MALHAQDRLQVRGIVVDKVSGKRLSYALIAVLDEQKQPISGVTADEEGRFQLNTPNADTLHLRVQYLGFQTLDTALMDRSGKGLITVTLPLTPQGHELSEVTVESVRQTAAVLPDKQVFLAD
ncbi:MAG: carboxypeptidase-like regulatory domain-containing protein, partial [Chitinophagales bacterium]|nr:carboxypeptidase-like regulatory domain-containing protein [Chitinophagales bacterium]MDW8428144.1 carboxypeptidase-like regulatory domain-containing protein [Chitinophagales bacterium]